MNDVKDLILEDCMYNFNFAKFVITFGQNDLYEPNIKRIIKLYKDINILTKDYKLILLLCECCKYIHHTREKNKGIVFARIYNTLNEFKPKKPNGLLKVTKWSKRKMKNYKEYQYLKKVSLCLSFLYGLQYKTQYTSVNKQDIIREINKSNDCLLIGLKSLIQSFDHTTLKFNLQDPISSVYDFF